jgi:hypothetical protein
VAPACAIGVVPAASYVSVTVSYQVPVFVPFLNLGLSDPGKGYRTVSATETMRIDPCGIGQ